MDWIFVFPKIHMLKPNPWCDGIWWELWEMIWSWGWSFREEDCCCPVAQSFLTLCDPMDCNTPGFPVLHCLLEFAQIHVRWVSSAIQPSHPLSLTSPFAFKLSQHQDLFLMSWLFPPGDQIIWVSVSASVLPMNIQGWFPLWLTGLIFLHSKRLSRAFSSTTIWKHQFFGVQPSLQSN